MKMLKTLEQASAKENTPSPASTLMVLPFFPAQLLKISKEYARDLLNMEFLCTLRFFAYNLPRTIPNKS